MDAICTPSVCGLGGAGNSAAPVGFAFSQEIVLEGEAYEHFTHRCVD